MRAPIYRLENVRLMLGNAQGRSRTRSRRIFSFGFRFQPPGDYPFTEENTAATLLGGSLTAALCALNTMDLWFTAPGGLVRTAHWDSGGGWASPLTIAGPISWSDTSLLALAMCVAGQGSGTAELFWIQQANGGTQFVVQNLRCGNTAASPPVYASQVVTDSGSPAPSSTPVAAYSATMGTVVAWITTTGAVQMAVRQAGGGPRSLLCAGSWDAAAPLPALYWIGNDGAITVAEWNAVTTPAGRLQLGYWASYKHNVSAGWRPVANSPGEITASWGSPGVVRLFWIATDSTVWTMRYPKPGAGPWPS
ncbi:hypothetical protein EJ06DRAFT_553051 [Trichodelitschia bisporula]|uniref:Fucose-specific lectin n=1 Tax=Trichodelitschia bisporula TaxID=703511 RepID=A0A6G1I7L7_9PEZI|nr:hypothetical protein EJ06DRAFT_553051 [Trichodelitschia bisporula]